MIVVCDRHCSHDLSQCRRRCTVRSEAGCWAAFLYISRWRWFVAWLLVMTKKFQSFISS